MIRYYKYQERSKMCTPKIISSIVIVSLFFAGQVREAQPVKIENSEGRHKLKSSVHVKRDFICDGEISPFQYGQFIEYLSDLVSGMWAEKLYDASFDEPQRVYPMVSKVSVKSAVFDYTSPPLSLTVLKCGPLCSSSLSALTSHNAFCRQVLLGKQFIEVSTCSLTGSHTFLALERSFFTNSPASCTSDCCKNTPVPSVARGIRGFNLDAFLFCHQNRAYENQ